MTEVELAFINFVSKHRRTYGTKEEYAFRFSQFKRTYEEVMNHDSEKEGYTKAINYFADMSDYEWNQMMGYKPRATTAPKNIKQLSVEDVADAWDWREHGAVNAV